MNKLKELINKEKGLLYQQQNDFERKFKLDCATEYFINDKGRIFGYNTNFEKLNFMGKYEVIGTVNEKTCYWRWGWSNPNLNPETTNYAKKMISFGEKHEIASFTNPKIKGKHNAFKFLVLSNYINKESDGYLIYKKKRSNILVYILIRNAVKPNISYKNFIEKILNNGK